MNTADRIQQLRKSKGISQEELADKIGVSRQAVSKWESEQSSPDIDKIILMSDFFRVTTDYILKGIEPIENDKLPRKKINAGIFAVAATAINLIGLIFAITKWDSSHSTRHVGTGLIFIVIGCMLLVIGMIISDPASRSKAIKIFSAINIWIIAFIPLSLFYNQVILKTLYAAPYPIFMLFRFEYHWSKIALFWIAYFAIGIVFDLAVLIVHRLKKK